MSRLLRAGTAAALIAAAFATAPASAAPCDVYTEDRRFSLFGATWIATFPVVDCG